MAYKSQWNASQRKFKTCDGPTVRTTQYGPMCIIPTGAYKAEFMFGLEKAKAIVKHLAHIQKFIRDQEQAKIDEYEEPVPDEDIEALVEQRKANILEQNTDESAYLRQILTAHETTENYRKFREGEAIEEEVAF